MTKDMTTGNPWKIIIFFSIPVLLGNLFQQFYNMADAVIVERMPLRQLAPPAPLCFWCWVLPWELHRDSGF